MNSTESPTLSLLALQNFSHPSANLPEWRLSRLVVTYLTLQRWPTLSIRVTGKIFVNGTVSHGTPGAFRGFSFSFLSLLTLSSSMLLIPAAEMLPLSTSSLLLIPTAVTLPLSKSSMILIPAAATLPLSTSPSSCPPHRSASSCPFHPLSRPNAPLKDTRAEASRLACMVRGRHASRDSTCANAEVTKRRRRYVSEERRRVAELARDDAGGEKGR